MKKLLIIAVLGFGAHAFYKNGYSLLPQDGAFDADGNPVVRVFVGPNCGQLCDDVKSTMSARHGRGYPLVYVGYRRFQGYREGEIKQALAALK